MTFIEQTPTIIKGDCIKYMEEMPNGSIDMIFADPPYNLQLGSALTRPDGSLVSSVQDSWDKFSSFEEYDQFTRAWLSESRRILKDTGSIWVSGSYHNIFRVGAIMQDLGFCILNDIIWIKTNPTPNFRGTRFTNAHETLIWASKSFDSSPKFNYKSMKIWNDDTQMRSDWQLPICSGKERLKDESGKTLHPTQKPEGLLYRIILASTNPGDLILDPFAGTGTTGAVAKKLSRRFIGIEQDPEYARRAIERISSVKPLPPELLKYNVDIRPPRVSFGNLLEMEYLTPGQTLLSKCGKYSATILANAALRCVINEVEITGSIHQVSAKILNKDRWNGWKFWLYQNNKGEWELIDILRERYRREVLGFSG